MFKWVNAESVTFCLCGQLYCISICIVSNFSITWRFFAPFIRIICFPLANTQESQIFWSKFNCTFDVHFVNAKMNEREKNFDFSIAKHTIVQVSGENIVESIEIWHVLFNWKPHAEPLRGWQPVRGSHSIQCRKMWSYASQRLVRLCIIYFLSRNPLQRTEI